MELEIYQVDAFCKNLFSGNSAGVCPMELGKKELSALQLSSRKGFLMCKDLGARIEITGGKLNGCLT